jgi:hypothetical protein
MRLTIDGPPEEGDAKQSLGKKLLWFVVLWCGSLAVVAAVAYALRALIL